MRTIHLLLATLVWVATSGPATADTIVNNRSGDPPGRAQDSPTVASIYAEGVGDMVVALWREGVSAPTPRFNYAVSRQAPLSFVDHDAVPEPAGYRWTFDPLVSSPPPFFDDAGTFYVLGQVRQDGPLPVSVGMGFVRGTATDPNTVSFGTPQVLAIFGAGSGSTSFINVLSMDVQPTTGVIRVLYLPVAADRLTPDLYTISSADGGTTWSAPVGLGSDSTRTYGSPRVLCGKTAGEVYYFWSELAINPEYIDVRVRRSADGGTTLGPVSTAMTHPTLSQAAPGGEQWLGFAMAAVMDRSNGTFDGSLILGATITMDLSTDVFPNLATAPAVAEVEPNDAAASATPFFPVGTVLRGAVTFSAPADTDYFYVDLFEGQQVAVWFDSSGTGPQGLQAAWIGPDGRTLLTSRSMQPGDRLGFAAPASARYYLRTRAMSSPSVAYRLRTTTSLAPYPGASDQRDVALSLKEPLGSWTGTQNIAPASPIGFDATGVRLAWNYDGALYVTYTDYAITAGRALARKVIRRSADGGATWGAAVPLASVATDWAQVSNSAGGIAFMQGQYDDLTTDGVNMYAVWTDGRNGDSDIFFKRIERRIQQFDQTQFVVTAQASQVVNVSRQIQNLDDVMPFGVRVRLFNNARNWVLPLGGGTLLAGQTGPIPITFTVPDTAAPGTVPIVIYYESGLPPYVAYASEVMLLTVTTTGGVDDEAHPRLSLSPATPNPAGGPVTLSYSLSRAGPATVEIYDVDGRRVRLLSEGERAAGRHTLTWDRAGQGGEPVRTGVYFVRLRAEGRVFARRVVCLE